MSAERKHQRNGEFTKITMTVKVPMKIENKDTLCSGLKLPRSVIFSY